MDRIADELKKCTDVQMQVAGYTDSQGRPEMNLSLSQSRAESVVKALMARRVLVGNLTAKGFGETNPIADNGTDAGREANRRIEFTLLPDTADATDSPDATAPDAAPDAATDDSGQDMTAPDQIAPGSGDGAATDGDSTDSDPAMGDAPSDPNGATEGGTDAAPDASTEGSGAPTEPTIRPKPRPASN